MLTLKQAYEIAVSLGDNCELGFAQRANGVEDGGLLRWAITNPKALVNALRTRFDGVYAFDNLIPHSRDMALDTKTGIAFHTAMYSSLVGDKHVFDESADERRAKYEQEKIKIDYMVAKLLDQLKTASKIFFYKKNAGVSSSDISDIVAEIRLFNKRNVLVLMDADGQAQPQFKKLSDNLYVATIDRFARYEKADDLNLLAWDFAVNQAAQAQAVLDGPAIPESVYIHTIDRQATLWRQGIAHELWFWARWFKTKGLEWTRDFMLRQDPDAPLIGAIKVLLPAGADPVRVLDVGAGPMTNVGFRVEGRAVSVTATDALADFYAQLAEQNAVAPPSPTVFSSAEDLSAYFPLEHYDIVHCCNALDHSSDPLRGIVEMLKVLKVGGSVYLKHHRNEAETERYEGFHQHNFDIQNGRFVIWGNIGSVDVQSALPVQTRVKVWIEGPDVVVTIEKREALPAAVSAVRLRTMQRAFVANGVTAAWTDLAKRIDAAAQPAPAAGAAALQTDGVGAM